MLESMNGRMTVSERIRQLGREGKSVSAIAGEVGVRYQHAYNVLRNAELIVASSRPSIFSRPEIKRKPILTSEFLLASGFIRSAVWTLSEQGEILTDLPLPHAVGVYALAKDGVVLYVGVATMGLAKRLYLYRKPASSQKTNVRINALIKKECEATSSSIDVLTSVPDDFEWNGLPVSGATGLEFGLIKRFLLPWNIRSAR